MIKCWLLLLCFGLCTLAWSQDLQALWGSQATLSFELTLDEPLRNGRGVQKQSLPLFQAPGFADLTLAAGSDQCSLLWRWQLDAPKAHRPSWLNLLVPGFEARHTYQLLYTWDAERGIFDGYVDGHPIRVPGIEIRSWTPQPCTAFEQGRGPFTIANITVQPTYTQPDKVPVTGPPIFSVETADNVADYQSRLGDVVEAPPLAAWITEGPVVRRTDGEWTVFASSNPTNKGSNGHIVWWCPKPLPASFVASWDIQIRSEYGLCIVFFAASPSAGGSIFAEGLKARDGTFTDYTNGDINSYHISYQTNGASNPGRPNANLRKNSGFYLMAQGLEGIAPGDMEVHRAMLIKDGAAIRLFIDNRLILAAKDSDSARYGDSLGGGYFGLRQMCWTTAAYRNLTIQELK